MRDPAERHAASRLLSGVRPAGSVEIARKQLARDLIAEIRAADQRLKQLTTQIEQTVAATGTRLREVDGIGPVIAAHLLGRTRRASRFPTAAAFASYAGVAPVEVASADHRCARRYGARPREDTASRAAATGISTVVRATLRVPSSERSGGAHY